MSKLGQPSTLVSQFQVDDIAFVVADLESGGTQRVVTNLANHWSKKGRNITVITLANAESDFFNLLPAVRRIVIGGQDNSSSFLAGLAANFQRIRNLRKTLRDLKPKYTVAFIAQTNILTILAGIKLKTKIIISERNDFRKQSVGRIWDVLRKRFYPMADLVTANSQDVVAAMASFVPEAKLAFLPNPIALFAGDPDKVKKNNVILNVGRLHEQKGHADLINAFARIADEHEDWTLEILGEGSERGNLETLISRLGLEGRVILKGRVTDVENYLFRAKIFAMPSRYEGTPNALLEALSAGLPSVISDATAGALEYVKHGESGYVHPVYSVDALAHLLGKLIDNPAIRKKFAVAGKQSVEHLSLEKVTETWEQVILKA
jgi:GalNAc-alpha-(1->4)-GalNAc-alpha-(1->3)-diNAcBac-PP-undecaprenol alpha-1,4-N-acetyl-D-galactosaminyltransferase